MFGYFSIQNHIQKKNQEFSQESSVNHLAILLNFLLFFFPDSGFLFFPNIFFLGLGKPLRKTPHTNQDELCFIISFSLCFYLSANKPWKLIAFLSPLLCLEIQQIELSAYFLHTNSI